MTGSNYFCVEARGEAFKKLFLNVFPSALYLHLIFLRTYCVCVWCIYMYIKDVVCYKNVWPADGGIELNTVIEAPCIVFPAPAERLATASKTISSEKYFLQTFAVWAIYYLLSIWIKLGLLSKHIIIIFFTRWKWRKTNETAAFIWYQINFKSDKLLL